LALSGPVDHRRFAPQSPGLAMHGIGTEAGFVPDARDILQKVIRANSRLSSKQNGTLH
jgi:hypothetical protein